jgi:hypothetical protein
MNTTELIVVPAGMSLNTCCGAGVTTRTHTTHGWRDVPFTTKRMCCALRVSCVNVTDVLCVCDVSHIVNYL